ncbi:MAG: hypothetical protein ACOVN0_00980 [Niveispirillum sp.]|uniref:hypothetical protein n=1 Tax=Niveispirillum sp. TaxID=1917217 RepID=UPI003BA43549
MTAFTQIIEAYEIAADAIRDSIGRPAHHEESPSSDGSHHLSNIADSAYFFMLFARFEHLVTEMAVAHVDKGRRRADPADRRVWSVLDVRKMDFLRRLALLTDKGSPDYATVRELYEDRNAIAHGRLIETKPNVKVVAAKLSGILSRLEGTP